MSTLLKSKFLPICFLTGVGFFVYANSLPNAFVWDDEEQIVHNSVIQSVSNVSEIFKGSTFSSGGGGLTGGFYRPLVSFAYMGEYQFFGAHAWGFHLIQIALHLLNVVLLFFLIQKFKPGFVAFFTALLFAVHPANVEAVSYSASIGELLFALFCILALCEVFSRWFFVFAFFGLLAKETAVVIFPIAFLYVVLFKKPSRSFYVLFAGGSALVVSLYAFLRFVVAKIPLSQFHIAPIAQASIMQRIITIPFELVSYAKTLFFPLHLSISQHVVVYSMGDFRFWGSLLFLAILSGVLFFFLKRQQPELRKIYGFSIAWFLLGIAPVIQPFVPLDMTIAERWLYFPAIGVFLFLCVLATQALGALRKISRKLATIGITFIIIIIFIFGARTIVRTFNWRNGLALYGHDIQYSQNSFELENNYGVELFRAGKIPEAKAHFEKSIILQPNWTYSRNNFGAVLESERKLNGALAEYKKSIELSDYYLAYENEASLLLRMGKQAEVETFIENALLKLPYNSKLNFFLAIIYYKEQKPQSDILPLLQRAVVGDPANAQAQQFYQLLQSGAKIQIQ